MDPGISVTPALIEAGHQLQSFKNFFLAGLTILFLDYVLTFNDEHDYFWKKKKGFVSYLFMFNRYYTLLAYIVTSFMFFYPGISHPVCERLGDFLPFGTGIPTLILSGILVAARVTAMYGGNKKLAAFLFSYLAAQTAATLYAFLFPGAGPLPLPEIHLDAYQACIELTSPRLGTAGVVWIAMDCGFDTVIITLTIYRSWQLHQSLGRLGHVFKAGNSEWYERPSLARRLVQDGLLYFMVLITLNITWVVMVIVATPGLKWICAMPAEAMIVVMVSRITLNLRAHVYGRDEFLTTLRSKPHMSFYKPGRAGPGARNREAAARAAGQSTGSEGKLISKGTFLDSGIETFESHYQGRTGEVELDTVVETLEMDDMKKQAQLPSNSGFSHLDGIPPYSATLPDSHVGQFDYGQGYGFAFLSDGEVPGEEVSPSRVGLNPTGEQRGYQKSRERERKQSETTSRLGRDVVII